MAATPGGRVAEGAIAEPDAEVIVGVDGEPGVRAGVWGFGGTRAGTTWRAGGAGTTSSSSKGSWLMAS